MRILCVVLMLLVSAGCTAGGTGVGAPAGPRGPEASVSTAAASEVVGYLDGVAVRTRDLEPLLIEAAGGEVLRELVLTRALERELDAANLSVGEADLEAERARLRGSLSDDPGEAAELLAALRRRRGLGTQRFENLIWRSAALRKLVGDDGTADPQELAAAKRILGGPRVRARLIVVPDAAEAQRIRQSLPAPGDDAARLAFAEAAMASSTDPSAARGGLLAPIHPEDPSYPANLRRTLARLAPGEISDVIALDEQFALIRVERIEPASATPDDASVVAQLQARRERLAMQALANELLGGAEVTILSPPLRRSYRASAAPGRSR